VARMAMDDALDIIQKLTKDEVNSFLTNMEHEAANEIKAMLNYEEKTAGSIMTTEYVSLIENQTKKTTLHEMKEMAPDAETIYYTYILDEQKKLSGVLSLRNLIVANDDEVVGEIMSSNVVSVPVGMDQEEVAKMMRDYDFLALPVVDFQQHLLGIITVDEFLDVMKEEATDDYSKLAALSVLDLKAPGLFKVAKMLFPWLFILFF